MTLVIRTLTLAEITTLVDWAAAEGWNPGPHDAQAFAAADPKGFLGGFVDDVIVAGIAAVAYNNDYGFIGLYICHPDHRGKGYGKAVWDAGMSYLGNRVIGLDGVPEQQANYASMGFVRSYETIRMSGVLPVHPHPETSLSLDDIAALDAACFPAQRSAFLHQWLSLPGHASAALREEGTVSAYAVQRPCLEGSKIGPVFARTTADALSLLSQFSGEVIIDVPAEQQPFIEALTTLGFSPGFRTARMYRGPAPSLDSTRVFGVTSLELG